MPVNCFGTGWGGQRTLVVVVRSASLVQESRHIDRSRSRRWISELISRVNNCLGCSNDILKTNLLSRYRIIQVHFTFNYRSPLHSMLIICYCFCIWKVNDILKTNLLGILSYKYLVPFTFNYKSHLHLLLFLHSKSLGSQFFQIIAGSKKPRIVNKGRYIEN